MEKPEEKNFFLYRLLNFPFFYSLVQTVLYKKNSKNKIFSEYFGINSDDKVLEIGCGPGINRKLINTDRYIGIDINFNHINKAKKKYPGEKFLCIDAVNFNENINMEIDSILICHLLHHLNDANCKVLLQNIYNNMKENQSVYLIDIVFKDNQNFIAKLLAKMDKGNYVRKDSDYLNLFDKNLFNVKIIYENKLLRLPSDFIITTLTKQ